MSDSFAFPKSPRTKDTSDNNKNSDRHKSKWASTRSFIKQRKGAFANTVPKFSEMSDEQKLAFASFEGVQHKRRASTSKKDTSLVAKLGKWIKQSFFSQEICVLVSDLSGFTRLTRKYGVIHFASVIVRKRQLCLPILHRHGALFISTEADNFIVVMPSAVAGAKAANEMQSVIFAYNESLPPEREHFKIILNGIGLDCGVGVAVDREDKLHGEVSNTAYHIGEDLCSDGRVLCSGRMATRLKEENVQGTLDVCEGLLVEHGAEGESVYEITNLQQAPDPADDIVGIDDAQFLHPKLLPFAQRHDVTIPEQQIINEIDVEIKKHEKIYTAIMFEFEMESLAETSGAAATLALKFEALDLLRPVLDRFNAIPLEDVLYVFENAEDAMDACLAAKAALDEDNQRRRGRGEDIIEISGFGMHTGNIIFVEGTDVHWGDPVNTSSKLGQDVAKGGAILATHVVHSKLSASGSRFSSGPIALKYVPFTIRVSKVDLECYEVTSIARKAYSKFKIRNKFKGAIKRVMCMERLQSMQHVAARKKAMSVMDKALRGKHFKEKPGAATSSSTKKSTTKWSHMRAVAHIRHGLFSRMVKKPEDMSVEERNTYLMYDATDNNTETAAAAKGNGGNVKNDEKQGISRRFSQKMSKWLKKSFFKQEICVLVSDLSGFTRLTRKYGVIHFASVIVRKRQLCLPILHRHGALFISTEADNFIVVMPSAVAGAKAANEMQSVIFAYNESLPPEREHFKIILNGIGLDCGVGVAVDREDKLHGEVSNTAYHIGEDLCSDGRVLCSGRMATRLKEEGLAANVTVCQDVTVKQGAEGEPVLEIQSIDNAPVSAIIDTDDATFLHPNLVPFAQRHNLNMTEQEVINTIDVEIRQHEKIFTALMFEFEMESIAMRRGAEATLTLKFQALDIIRPVLVKFNAIPLEDVLYVFNSPSDALAAALAARQTIEAWNTNNRLFNRDELDVSGFGMHTGNIIFVEGTDIHWGDPVNTSSKLGQDTAKDGIILISGKVKEGVDQEWKIDHGTSTKHSPFTKERPDKEDGGETRVLLNFVPKEVTVSKVSLDCYVVTSSEPIAIPSITAPEEPDVNDDNDDKKGGERAELVVVLSKGNERDVSWHPAEEIRKEEGVAVSMKQDETLLRGLNPESAGGLGGPSNNNTPATPANTPSRPKIPWLRTLSPKRHNKPRSPYSSATTKLATKAYTQVPNIPFDNGWSKVQKQQITSTFGRQNASPVKNRGGSAQSKGAGKGKGKGKTKGRRPKERESVLTQQRQAMTLADEVIQDAEVQKLRYEARERKIAKKKWRQRLISPTLYGSPTSKPIQKLSVSRPGSPTKAGSIKPRRPASSQQHAQRGGGGWQRWWTCRTCCRPSRTS